VCVGSHPEGNAGWAVVDSPSQGKEAVDRKAITLPAGQEEFVRRVLEANPKTGGGRDQQLPRRAARGRPPNASTILHVTHNSQELGNALADVLLGDFNPGGRLAQTWPKALEDLPPMMDYDIRHGRTYLYAKAEPQYPLRLRAQLHHLLLCGPRHQRAAPPAAAPISVSVDVTNKGARNGDEVVQLYVRYPDSKVPRPLKQLRGFQRVEIASGQTRTITLPLAAEDLAYWSPEKHAWVVEPGKVELLVGPVVGGRRPSSCGRRSRSRPSRRRGAARPPRAEPWRRPRAPRPRAPGR
jgi:beta-glucosidase